MKATFEQVNRAAPEGFDAITAAAPPARPKAKRLTPREREQLFAQWKGFAYGAAYRIANRNPAFRPWVEDLRQDALSALHRATLSFDPSQGMTFYGYTIRAVYRELWRSGLRYIRIASGQARARGTSSDNFEMTEQTEPFSREFDPEETFARRELATRAIDLLLERQRQKAHPLARENADRNVWVFVSTEFAEASGQQAAMIFASSRQAAQQRMNRIRGDWEAITAQLRGEL